ncbi:hypothetical protein CSB20_03620 [bacterium DOLZORAL124_64_63]|nr:MAG: hypothetical protein CSB20_03620 [bacterium DOLZORAL124_64_63]
MKNDDAATLKLGWSDFAAARHRPHGKHTWYEGSHAQLLDLVRKNWAARKPGAGRHDLSQVVVVPVPPAGFVGNTVKVDENTVLHAHLDCRQAGEDAFIRVTAEGRREAPRFASVVLYSRATLQENGGACSGDYDWEVVCLLAGQDETEPMDPLTMARNFLEKPGGTYASYTAQQFAEAIYYWSGRATAHVDD